MLVVPEACARRCDTRRNWEREREHPGQGCGLIRIPSWEWRKRKEREQADIISWCCRAWVQPAEFSSGPESLA